MSLPEVKISENNAIVLPVAVIIPCYRCAKTVRRAVSSVLHQVHKPAEIILVEDASGDSTINVLHEIKAEYSDDIRIIELDENSGAGSARNAGWDIASQPYIAFLDADDTWHPDKLRLQYAFMIAHPDVALSGNLCDDEKSAKQVLDPFSEQPIRASIITPFRLLFKNAFSTPTVMLRTDISHRFTRGRRHAEDFLLWQQIAFSGFKIVRLEAPLAQLHKPLFGASGLSANMWKMEQGELLNFLQLRKEGWINLPTCLFAILFSLIKFARRLVLVYLPR